MSEQRLLLSGNEAVALAARDAGVRLGTGYPGTPSTEILEEFDALGGHAQWAPNEKVALEVGIGVSWGGGRTLVTMKHVGLNVAADPLFTLAYTGVAAGLVIVSADDPGMASSQNEQDNRRYAVAAGVPMLEPSDSQEAYDFALQAFTLSEMFSLPILFRMTTRVCHSKTIVKREEPTVAPPSCSYQRDIPGRVMIPAYARPAHRRLREKLHKVYDWTESCGLNYEILNDLSLGIITSGVTYMHAREAAPDASFLKLGATYPIPVEKMRAFASKVKRCLVIEEGDPYLEEAARAAGIPVEGKSEAFRFGELNVSRVRRILAGENTEPAPKAAGGVPPRLCPTCPHRLVFMALGRLGCVVAGDIGCYTLGVLPPFEAMDSCVCMGASIGVGLGLRHAMPDAEAKRVVSVIGDSTFIHSGITGIVEMVYNPPKTGHVVIILDNGTTAMTGLQEHPGTGRALDHQPANQVVIEEICRAIGVTDVHVVDPVACGAEEFESLVRKCLDNQKLTVIVARRPCALLEKKLKALNAVSQTVCSGT